MPCPPLPPRAGGPIYGRPEGAPVTPGGTRRARGYSGSLSCPGNWGELFSGNDLYKTVGSCTLEPIEAL